VTFDAAQPDLTESSQAVTPASYLAQDYRPGITFSRDTSSMPPSTVPDAPQTASRAAAMPSASVSFTPPARQVAAAPPAFELLTQPAARAAVRPTTPGPSAPLPPGLASTPPNSVPQAAPPTDLVAAAGQQPSIPESILAPFPELMPKGHSSSSQVTAPSKSMSQGQQQPVIRPGPVRAAGTPTFVLHVDNLDVNKVLELVSRQANMSISIASGIHGQVTLHLRDKTADETLSIIAQECHLTIRRDRDVIYVTSEEDALPIRTYHLNYVTANDLQSMIQPLLSEKGKISVTPQSEVGLKSDVTNSSGGTGNAGSTQEVKAGGNSLAGGDIMLVQDHEEVLHRIDRLVAEIDVQPIQVLIEAVIVEVELNKGMELGVNFALLDKAGTTLGVIGDGGAINAAAGFTPASVLTAGGKLVGTAASGFAEDANGLKFGWTGGSTTGFIRALENFGETRVLASPRLMVLNKQRAEIHIGQQLGYMTTTVNLTSSTQTVSFMAIGTQLRLRPFVTPNGLVRLEIHPERSTGKIDTNGIPQTYTNQVTTNMTVPDGATIMIGGMIDTEVERDWQGLPFLSRIPLLGYLFRHTVDDLTKKELIVLITPHIWNPQCPQALNYLGKPHSESLQHRVRQQEPFLEHPGEESLYQQMAPSCN
jgi:general secretion pathway protein D